MNSEPIFSYPTLSGEVFDSLPESIRSYIRYLETTIQQQQIQIQQLQVRVHDLEARLAKNSFIPIGDFVHNPCQTGPRGHG